MGPAKPAKACKAAAGGAYGSNPPMSQICPGDRNDKDKVENDLKNRFFENMIFFRIERF